MNGADTISDRRCIDLISNKSLSLWRFDENVAVVRFNGAVLRKASL